MGSFANKLGLSSAATDIPAAEAALAMAARSSFATPKIIFERNLTFLSSQLARIHVQQSLEALLSYSNSVSGLLGRYKQTIQKYRS
jgi:hypothetical protein